MQTGDKVCFFLGSNSPTGFYSLYDQLIDLEQANAIYILKGGPGCGKSSLMRRIGTRAEEMGEQVEYIHCSGDPDSLDAIILHKAKTAIVDGTAPHVVEPRCPGAIESYVNLGDCYDKSALHQIRRQIADCTVGYKDCYKRAYRCLQAAEQIAKDTRSILITKDLEEKAAKRARGILSREVRNSGNGTGRVTQRFLGSVTHRGVLTYYSTAEILCKRIYMLEDSFGLSYLLLTHLLNGLTHSGYDVIVCPSPTAPDHPEHLIVPALSLAFVSAPPDQSGHKRPYRKIRMDAMADPELIRHNKARLRFSRKISSALTDEAVSSLAQAKSMHDTLEALYNPHVDFEQVYRIADKLSEAILLH